MSNNAAPAQELHALSSRVTVRASHVAVLALIAAAAFVFPTSALGAACQEVADGTTPPPTTLGGHPMAAFPTDGRPVYSAGTPRGGPGWVGTLLGPLGSVFPVKDEWTYGQLEHLRVGASEASWAKWPNSYRGDIYVNPALGGRAGTQMSVKLPLGTKAFYFYLQPENRGSVEISTVISGSDSTTGPLSCDNFTGKDYGIYDGGNGNARLFTIFMSADDNPANYLDTILISTQMNGDPVGPEGVAIGELGISKDTLVASPAAALQQFVPILHYSMFENFRADAADEITDNYVPRSGRARYTNALEDGLAHGPARTIATSDPGLGFPQLSLNYLGTYSAGSTGAHHIDEANNYEADAGRLHASGYANRVYGRVVPGSPPDGGWVLQYWLFYYDNPKTYFGFGAHEGDWEMVQVEIDPDLQPRRAAYSQHDRGETCAWDRVEKENGRPVVYVADGSHANYFTSGFHGSLGARDEADGFGETVDSLSLEDVTAPPRWLSWAGQWGGSDSSPVGPAYQGRFKWTDPLAWSAGNDSCTT